MASRWRPFAAALWVLWSVPVLRAQDASPTPAPAAADSRALIDQLGGCVESGNLNIEVDLTDGNYPAAPAWVVRTEGSPQAAMKTVAAEGRVRRLDASLTRGTLLVDGKGLRPNVYVEGFTFEDGKGITQAKFRGKGIWRPIVGVFGGVAMSALRKLHFQTDIPSMMRGEIFAPRAPAMPGETSAPPAAAAPAAAPAPTPAPGGPSFLDLVQEVRVADSALIAFPGKPLTFGEMVEFETASGGKGEFPLRVTVDRGLFQPGHVGAASKVDIEGRIDGEIEDGKVGFGESHSTFSRGELRGGTYHVSTGDAGAFRTEIGASYFGVDLTSGDFRIPGGPEVDVGPPSRFGIRDLKVQPDGEYSGLVDADLYGKVGRVARPGSVISATDVHMRTQGLRVAEGRANGDVELQFNYRVDHTLVVDYPVEQLGVRRYPLVFQGPFTTRLHLENAGPDGGAVSGDYSFKIPWPPVEQAAVVLLSARWSQDIQAVIRKVDFEIQPRRFGPCGGTCFVVELGLTAEKKKASGKSLFKQICEPEGKADLVVDAASRSFQLRNIKVLPRCKGVVGWIVNFVAPLVTKTYTDMTVFQMPAGLPFTIESVGSGANYVAIAGRVDFDVPASAPAPAAEPSQ